MEKSQRNRRHPCRGLQVAKAIGSRGEHCSDQGWSFTRLMLPGMASAQLDAALAERDARFMLGEKFQQRLDAVGEGYSAGGAFPSKQFDLLCLELRSFDRSELEAVAEYLAYMALVLNRSHAASLDARFGLRKVRRERQRGGATKNKKKIAAKVEALKLWQARVAGQHPKLRTNEQFATEVMRRWPILTSSKVICGWCSTWNRQAKKKNPAS